MKDQLQKALLLICVMALAACASNSPLIPVVANCPTLLPAPQEVMVKRQHLSQDQLQQDLLADTPTTTK